LALPAVDFTVTPGDLLSTQTSEKEERFVGGPVCDERRGCKPDHHLINIYSEIVCSSQIRFKTNGLALLLGEVLPVDQDQPPVKIVVFDIHRPRIVQLEREAADLPQ
jgi:hypothetical protein